MKKNYYSFEKSAGAINRFIKEEGHSLTFKGYTSFLNEYVALSNTDIEDMGEVSKKALLWSDYLSQVHNTMSRILFDWELKYSMMNTTMKTWDKDMVDMKNKINLMKIFLKHLKIQRNTCVTIFFKTVKGYKENMNDLNFQAN